MMIMMIVSSISFCSVTYLVWVRVFARLCHFLDFSCMRADVSIVSRRGTWSPDHGHVVSNTHFTSRSRELYVWDHLNVIE